MTTRAIHPVNHAVDWAAAVVPAGAAGWAAGKIAPLVGYPTVPSAVAASLPLFLLALAAMRRSGAPESGFRVATFVPPAIDEAAELLLEMRYAEPEELILDEPVGEAAELLLDQPFVERTVDQLAELLLDDPLAALPSDSRVVRLFAPAAMPSAGDLAARIDRHLGNAPVETPVREGEDALKDALDELRRSLRRA